MTSDASEGPGRISVVGRASRWAPADHADVTFTAGRRAATSEAAATEAGRAYAALDGALADHAAGIRRRTTTSMTVQEVVRYDPETGRSTREGFEASRTETVRFSPVDGAGAALRAVLGAVPEVVVAGPVFGLDQEHPVHAGVRADAAAAARASAAAYASGLGLELGPVLSLAEPEMGRGSGEGDLLSARAFAQGGGADGGETVLVDLSNEDVEVTAAVRLVVAIA